MSNLTYGQTLARDSSYSATDTTGWVAIGNGNLVLVFIADDSVNCSLRVDYAESPNSTTNFQSYTASDSTNSVNATGFFKGYLLRAGATNNIPGAGAVRLVVTRVTDAPNKNGTTTPNYDAYIRQY